MENCYLNFSFKYLNLRRSFKFWYQHFQFNFTTIPICSFHTKALKMHIFPKRCEKDQMVARFKINVRKFNTNTDP